MDKKEILGLMFVGNEDDILEQSIRHNIRYLDQLTAVLDFKSVDGSREILENLISEGLPINITFRPAELDLDFRSSFVNQKNAWAYVFIDDDEFICGLEPKDLRNIIFHRVDPTFIAIPWKTFVINPRDFDCSDIPRSLKYARKFEEPKFYKAIYIRCNAEQPHKIGAGAHSVLDLAGITFGNLMLAHYPVRSVKQLTLKYFASNLDYTILFKNNMPKGYGFQQKEGFKKLVNGEFSGPESLYVESMLYSSSRQNFSEEDIEELIIDLVYTKSIKIKELPTVQLLAKMIDAFGKCI
jgi:hypothetical protein